jgi:hypothetical protein
VRIAGDKNEECVVLSVEDDGPGWKTGAPSKRWCGASGWMKPARAMGWAYPSRAIWWKHAAAPLPSNVPSWAAWKWRWLWPLGLRFDDAADNCLRKNPYPAMVELPSSRDQYPGLFASDV